MRINKLKHDIFYIENFLNEDECQKIIKYLEFLVSNNVLQWNQISFYESYAMGFWQVDPRLLSFGLPEDFFNRLKMRIKSQAEEVLGIELSEVSYHAQKWTEGAFASFHSDNTDEEGNPTPFERSKFAAFIYLNEDFEGGKLNFKNFDISVQPSLGALAVFSGTFGNEHEVTTVKSGTRYTIGSFWDDAKSVYTEEQKENWAVELKKIRDDQDVLYKVWAEDRARGVIPSYKGKNE